MSTTSSAQIAAFDPPNPELDLEVAACLETEGVSVLPDTNTICYNSAIFPGEFLQLADIPAADRIIISSPGGNVATSRMMARILDNRAEPIVIAGQCMSACAMVILPGADDISIHRSAHIAVHGIVMMKFDQWLGWLKGGVEPTSTERMMAGLGYNFDYTLHKTGQDQMIAHLEGQKVNTDYIKEITGDMLEAALAWPCRVKPDQYWGMLDADYLRRYLGERITHMEAFAQSWDDPNNTLFKEIITPVSSRTYIFNRDYEDAVCPED